ncbi:MAG: hypothetical protein WDN69_29040 [Aliidongia sp.]
MKPLTRACSSGPALARNALGAFHQDFVGIGAEHGHRLCDELIERHRRARLATVHEIGPNPGRGDFQHANAGVFQQKAL